jgi:hypothetical protein
VLQACKNDSGCAPARDIHFKIVGDGNTVSRVNLPGQGGATPQPSFDWPNIRNATADVIFQGIIQPKNDIERVISSAAHFAQGESASSPGDSGSPLILLDSSGNELETIGVLTNGSSYFNPGFELSQDLSPQSSQAFIQCIKKAGTDPGETYTDVVNEINLCGHKPTLNP